MEISLKFGQMTPLKMCVRKAARVSPVAWIVIGVDLAAATMSRSRGRQDTGCGRGVSVTERNRARDNKKRKR